MKLFVYGDGSSFERAMESYAFECAILAGSLGFQIVHRVDDADIAIAPLLRRRLTDEEWSAPIYGTLIFHPSALPYRRGPDAIKHAIAAGERVSAVTWFWCNGQLDAGDICEQEVVVLCPGERPREAYERRFRPAGLRALHRALLGVKSDNPRRIVQDERLATYDGKFAA